MSGFAVHSRRLAFCGVAMSMMAGLIQVTLPGH